MHESLDRDDASKPRSSSDRAFGMVMAGFFGIVGLWPLLEPAEPRWWSLAIAAAFLVLAALVPRSLTPLNRLWTAFGLLLHKITNPLFLGVIYFLAVVPTGLVLRALGKDLLRTRFDKSAASYWIKREPPGPPPATMTRQF
jgi:hypothetical protein